MQLKIKYKLYATTTITKFRLRIWKSGARFLPNISFNVLCRTKRETNRYRAHTAEKMAKILLTTYPSCAWVTTRPSLKTFATQIHKTTELVNARVVIVNVNTVTSQILLSAFLIVSGELLPCNSSSVVLSLIQRINIDAPSKNPTKRREKLLNIPD